MRSWMMMVVSVSAMAACGGGGKNVDKSDDLAGNGGHDMAMSSDSAVAAGYVFGGSSGTGSFNGSGGTISLAASSAITAATTFMVTSETGSGEVTITDAIDHAMNTSMTDVTPDTLPVDDANANDTNPVLYYAFANAGTDTIKITAAAFTLTPTPNASIAGFIGASSQCEFDTYDASTKTWTSQGVSANFAGPAQTTYTISNIVLSGGSISLPPGQTIGALLCN